MWYWHKDIHTNQWGVHFESTYTKIDQWNRADNSAINLYDYSQLIFKKDAKTIHWGNNSLFKKKNGAETTRYAHAKDKCKSLPYSIYCQLKWTKDLNLRA